MEHNVDITGATRVAPGAPDWTPPIERLRSEANAARESGRPDPWTRVEAECWIDLIDAELAAQRAARDPGTRSATIGRLRHWRAELQLIVRQLQAAEHEMSRRDMSARPHYPQTAEKFCA